jgi:protein TonB
VILSVEIFTDGSVGSLKIKKSSGYTVLDKSALEAVKTWKFEPGRKIGKPVIMWVDVPVKFVLKDTTDVAGW